MLLIFSPRFAEHTPPPGHPERPERAGVFARVADEFRAAGGTVVEPAPAAVADLARIHRAAHIDQIAGTAGRAAMLDPDTFTSPASYEIARLAAGAAIDAARHAWRTGEPALALVRPPGHHAEPDRVMGFCLFNNIAIAAAALRADGVERVAIVDIDVHHGNGTQVAFYDDPAVLFISSHQFPYYPGSGAADETGEGPGRGFTVNVPLSAGATDADYRAAYESLVVPALDRFRPQILLVSAGFDAHQRDPLAGMRMTASGYATVIGLIRAAAGRHAGGRLALVTEGGYDLAALRECLDAAIGVLD